MRGAQPDEVTGTCGRSVCIERQGGEMVGIRQSRSQGPLRSDAVQVGLLSLCPVVGAVALRLPNNRVKGTRRTLADFVAAPSRSSIVTVGGSYGRAPYPDR